MKLRKIPLLLGIFAPLGLSACGNGSTSSSGDGVIPVKKPIAIIAGGGSYAAGIGQVFAFNLNTESLVQIGESVGNCAIKSLTQTIDGTIYAAGCDDSGFGGVYSTNDGTSWTTIESGLGLSSITSMASNGDIVYAGGNVSYSGGENNSGGIFTFKNGVPVVGNLIESQIGFGAVSSMAISPDGVLYTGNLDAYNSLSALGLISSVSSESATTIQSGIGYLDCPINALALKSGNLYAAGCDESGTGAIYKYSGGVGPVESLATGLGLGAVYGLKSLAVADDGTVYAGGVGAAPNVGGVVYKYANGTPTTLESGIGENECPITALTLDHDGTLYAGGCDSNGNGAIYKYANDVWSTLESGIPGSQINSLVVVYQ